MVEYEDLAKEIYQIFAEQGSDGSIEYIVAPVDMIDGLSAAVMCG